MNVGGFCGAGRAKSSERGESGLRGGRREREGERRVRGGCQREGRVRRGERSEGRREIGEGLLEPGRQEGGKEATFAEIEKTACVGGQTANVLASDGVSTR